jgi:cell division control protein 7
MDIVFLTSFNSVFYHLGTFSSVYTAVDLEYDHYDNSSWEYIMDSEETKDTKRLALESGSSNSEKVIVKSSEDASAKGKVVAIKRIYVTSSPERIESEIAILHDLRFVDHQLWDKTLFTIPRQSH